MTRQNRIELAHIAILASLGRKAELGKLLRSSPVRRISAKPLVETLLEVHLFAGFPATIESLIVLRTCRPKSTPRVVRRPARGAGKLLIRRVYGKNYGPLMKRMRDLDQSLSSWIVTYGYGTVLARPGLTLRERELIAIGSLAALNWGRQLRSHVLSALNIGVEKKEIMSVLRLARREVKRTPRGLIDAAREMLVFLT